MSPRSRLLNFRPKLIADQAAEALRDGIMRGTWGDHLPGEHELARQLGISPPTMHKAFKALAQKGLIQIKHGRRARIVTQPSEADSMPTVCLVAPGFRTDVGLTKNPLLHALRLQLMACGIRWDEIIDPRLAKKTPEEELARIVTNRSNVCWLVVHGTSAVQRWFEKSGLPTLVLGSCRPGNRLPSVDLDYRAIGWHAAGNATRLGHRHIALIMRDRPLPGDLAFRDGASQYLQRAHDGNALTVITANANALDLHLKLGHLMKHRSRPTVLLVMEPEHALAALIHLPRCGLRIPEDVSVVSIASHPLFESGMPELTHYRTTIEIQIRRTVRLIQALLAQNSIPPKPILIMPTFVLGKTLARPLSAAIGRGDPEPGVP